MFFKLNQIGDGLFMELAEDDNLLITDFGSQQGISNALFEYFYNLEKSFTKIDFALSHFHQDHYSGLLALLNLSWYTNFDTLYIPRLPKEDIAIKLYFAIQSMLSFKMGEYSGSMEYDFISLIRQLNRSPFILKPLSKGDSFSINGKDFTVSWPTRNLSIDTLTHIARAVHEFENQIAVIPRLKELYTKIQGSDRIWIHASQSQKVGVKQNKESFKIQTTIQPLTKKQRAVFNKLNSILKKGANSLSLCYYNEGYHFMGDLESREIDQCIAGIKVNKPDLTWPVIVLPHHGTHWHHCMRSMKGFYGLSSNGPKMYRHWKKKNNKICFVNLMTHKNGTILI